MYDYNFFGVYKVKKKKTDHGTAMSVFLFLIFLLACGGMIGYQYYELTELENEVAILDEQYRVLNTDEILKQVDEKRLLLNELQNLRVDLLNVPATLDKDNSINQALFDSILSAIPKDLEMTYLLIDGKLISISGKAGLNSAVAEFQRSLRNNIKAESILVSRISNVENEFIFDIAIDLGGDDVESEQ